MTHIDAADNGTSTSDQHPPAPATDGSPKRHDAAPAFPPFIRGDQGGSPASEQTVDSRDEPSRQPPCPTDTSRQPTAANATRSGPAPFAPADRRKCVILVPFATHIHPECDDALRELERRGYPVRRVGGYAAIDQGRNQMATDALRDGFEETMWIDADIGFHPDCIDRLRAHSLPIVAGIYPQKAKRALACHVLEGSPSITFGQAGGLFELLYVATGFLLVRREVYLKVQEHCRLPACNEQFGQPMIPFFQPMVCPTGSGHWYLAEDYAFCQRAREAGFRIFGDTTIRLSHLGTYAYGWEDAGRGPQRFANFTLHFAKPPESQPAAQTAPFPPFVRGGQEGPEAANRTAASAEHQPSRVPHDEVPA
jgi:hypothetical protein